MKLSFIRLLGSETIGSDFSKAIVSYKIGLNSAGGRADACAEALTEPLSVVELLPGGHIPTEQPLLILYNCHTHLIVSVSIGCEV